MEDLPDFVQKALKEKAEREAAEATQQAERKRAAEVADDYYNEQKREKRDRGQ